MKIAIVIFDKFTDLDLFLMWDLLNRVRVDNWEVRILGEKESHISATGIAIPTHGRIDEANDADAVMFVSGQGTRDRIADEVWAAYSNLNTAFRQREAAAALLTAATESYSAALESYNYGVRNLLDVTNAQKVLAQARSTDILARTQVLAALADLVFRTGDAIQINPRRTRP